MTKAWADVAASPQFQALAPADRESARQQYFQQVVAPQLGPNDVATARSQFDAATSAPAAAAPAAPAAGPAGPSLADQISSGFQSAAAAVSSAASYVGGKIAPVLAGLASSSEGADGIPDAGRVIAPPAPSAPRISPIDTVPQDTSPLKLPDDRPMLPFDSEKSPARVAAEQAAAAAPKATALSLADDNRIFHTEPQGAIRAGFNITAGRSGQTLSHLATAAGEALDSVALRDTGRQWKANADEHINRAMAGNEDSDAVKTAAGVFGLAPLLGGAGTGIASMVTQAGVDGYGEARQAGATPAEAIGRGTAMALANYVGMRVSVPGLSNGLMAAVSKAPAGDALAALGHAIATNVGGMEATTVLSDVYDKVAPGGLRPDMSVQDMVHDIGATAKSATLLSLAMPGIPLGASHLYGAAHALAHGQGNVADAARAIDGAQPPAGGPALDSTNVADGAPAAAQDTSSITAPAQPMPILPGIDTLHNSIDDAAAKVGLMPKAAAALRDAVAKMDPQDASAFAARAFHRYEANGLTTKAGAPGAFRDALQVRTDALQPDVPDDAPASAAATAPAAAPAPAGAAPTVADQLAAIRPLDAVAPHDELQIPESDAAPITPTAMAQANDIAGAAHEAATSPFNDTPQPTDGQKGAGNYKLGHVQLHGLDVSIENPQGSVRSGVDPDGKPWSNEMAAHYGYIKGTHASDGDHVDTFIGPNPESQTAYVIDQVDPTTGKFDEPKTILGADTEQQARELYAANYKDGWNGLGAITAMPIDAFKTWVHDGVKDQPLGDITQWKPTDERAQPDLAKPADVAPGAGDGGGGPAVAGGGDPRPDPAGTPRPGTDADAAAPESGARAAGAVGDGSGADAALKPLPALKDSDLAAVKSEDLEAMHDRAIAHNKAVDATALAKFFDHETTDKVMAMSQRRRDNWFNDNLSTDQEDWLQARYINDGLIADHRNAAYDFDTESAQHLGASIALRARKVDEPGFFDSADGRTVAEAFKFAREKGWSLDSVVGGMRDRASRWAGDNAPELFARLFREAKPAAEVAAPPRLLGKPVTEHSTSALEKVANGKATSLRARDVAGAELMRRANAERAAPPVMAQPEQVQQAKSGGASGTAKHPATVAGSRLLALVSKNVGGLDPAWLGEFSSKQETKRMGADGRPITQWKNPLIPGVGKLFRRGGTQDLESLANMLQEHHYLPPGTVERDPHAAGQQAQDIIRAALNRVEPKTMYEQEAEDEASRHAEADAHYAALDAASAREAEAERQSMFEAHNIDPSAFDRLMTDDDVARGVPDISDHQALADFLGLTPEELDNERRSQESESLAGEDRAGAQAGSDAAGGARAADEARVPAARPADEGDREGLTLEAQTPADLKAKTDRETAARTADAAEQKRLADKATADSQRDDFKLTGSDRAVDVGEANGQTPLLSAERTTDTPEFKKWFGDSRVTDAKGDPRVVFHGSPDMRFLDDHGVFETLKDRMAKYGSTPESRRAAAAERGFFFTTSERVAKTYADPRRAFDYQNSEPGVAPAYLSIKNPLAFDAAGKHWREAQAQISKENFIARAKAAGHDGVLIRNVRDSYDSMTSGKDPRSDVYVAFDSKQIKHATRNSGAFDPANPDIRTKQSADTLRTGVDPAALQSEVERIQAGWKDAPPVHVVADVNGLPNHIQDSLRSMGAEGKTRALLMPGKGSDPGDVYLIANRLRDLPMAQAALFHEVLGHYGIRKVLGTDATYFAEMYKLRQANPALAGEAESWYQAHGRGALAGYLSRGMKPEAAMKLVRALSTEEALADRAGKGEPIRGLQSLMAKIQTWLRSVGMHSMADRLEGMTQAETAALLSRSRRAVEAEGDGPVTSSTDHLVPALSQSSDAERDPDVVGGTTRPAAVIDAVRAAGQKMLDAGRALRDNALLGVAPMALGNAETRAIAKDFANADRLARWQWGKFDDVLKKSYTEEQRKTMWEAADQENVLRQQGITASSSQGLNRLTPDQRQTMDTLHNYGESLLQRAKDVGMFQGEGLPYWTPRMAVMIGDSGEYERPKATGGEGGGTKGGNIVTSASSLKERKYLTSEETEAAMKGKLGEGAQLVRDIRTMPLAMARLERAIAGRDLVNNIKAFGARAGIETVSDVKEPGFFTVDHPAFKTWREVKRDDGTTMMQSLPLYVNGNFEGPLKAVMADKPGAVYSALMALKSKSMGLIMYSPLIHNAVEWGRAMPLMPGKVASFQIYFEGNRIKNDPQQMRQAISDGMVPIGRRGGVQDITGIMEDPSLVPGRSWTAKLIGGALGLANEKAGTAAKKAIDTAGDVWHNTLLWDRVGDLQAGLYGSLKDEMIHKGMAPDAAGKMAAHWANRFAGALPNEAMSANARKVANLVMFSRSFTLGNMGLMKDMISGLPRDVRAQIRQQSGPLIEAAAVSKARKVAIAAFIVDVGLMYVGNSVMQDAIKKMRGEKSWGEVGQGYLDRLHKLMQRTGDHPLDTLSNPFDMVNSVSSTSENEPGKEDRIRVGTSDDGTAIYMRLPTGKVGEDFKNWVTRPLITAKAKESQLVRPLQQIWNNDNGIGQRIYDPDAEGIGGVVKNAGRIAKLFATQMIPADAIQGALDWKNGSASDVDKLKVVGPFAGLTFSKGAPGGPAVGAMYDADRKFLGAKMDVMPDVKKAIKEGDDNKAIALMEGIKMTPAEIRVTLKRLEVPESRMSAGAFKHFADHATDDQMQRATDLMQAESQRQQRAASAPAP
jgi:hypothetical protein